MPLTLTEWDQRFQQQATWTEDLRAYLYPQIELGKAQRVLDIGCGTGVLVPELCAQSEGQVYGGDWDLARLKLAIRNSPAGIFFGADAHALPFPTATFDLALCHFLLLWVDDPVDAVREMCRVTTPGGSILALAEPDYGGRLDYPPQLAKLKEIQTNALRDAGADPHLGRELRSIFTRAGCRQVTTGVLGAQWRQPPSPRDHALEWKVIAEDAGETLSAQELHDLKELDKLACERGERVLYTPTFYAWGKV